jgi:hypothetical protein
MATAITASGPPGKDLTLRRRSTQGTGRCHHEVARAGLSGQLDARHALAEIEMKAGQITAEREHLTAIEADAKAKGYTLLARKPAVARKRLLWV